jgi:hypothetical protein
VRAVQLNPRFLDAKLFEELVLAPYRETKFEPHTGPFLFEFQRHGMSTDEFCSRLDQFSCVSRVTFGTRWRFAIPASSV